MKCIAKVDDTACSAHGDCALIAPGVFAHPRARPDAAAGILESLGIPDKAMVLAARRPVLPAQKILETTQDRLIEKDFVTRLGIGTADYADVSSVETLQAAKWTTAETNIHGSNPRRAV